MNIRISKAIFQQRNAKRWYDLAQSARERYIETRYTASLDLFLEASEKARFFSHAARFMMGVENARHTQIHVSLDGGFACNVDRGLDGRPLK